MTNYVTLDNNQHADINVSHEYSAQTGAQVNQTRVFITEFEALQKEYPIFFRQAENGDFYAVTILGLDKDENLFLDETSWSARYVPAAFRRGPFQIGRAKSPNGSVRDIINIDMNDPRISRGEEKGTGNALFLPSGGLSPYLMQISKTLELITAGLKAEKSFFEALSAHDLLKLMTVQITVSDRKNYTIPDVYSIDKDKFINLKGAALEGLHQSGLLAQCQWVLTSLDNTNNLLERKLKQTACAAAMR